MENCFDEYPKFVYFILRLLKYSPSGVILSATKNPFSEKETKTGFFSRFAPSE